MSKRLVITVDDDVYAGLYEVIGRGRISRFLNDLARPHVVGANPGPARTGSPAPDCDGEPEQPPVEWVEKGVCP